VDASRLGAGFTDGVGTLEPFAAVWWKGAFVAMRAPRCRGGDWGCATGTRRLNAAVPVVASRAPVAVAPVAVAAAAATVAACC